MTLKIFVIAVAALCIYFFAIVWKLEAELDRLRDAVAKTVERMVAQNEISEGLLKYNDKMSREIEETAHALRDEIVAIDSRVCEIETVHLDSMKEQAKQEKLFSDGLENILNFYNGGEQSK